MRNRIRAHLAAAGGGLLFFAIVGCGSGLPSGSSSSSPTNDMEVVTGEDDKVQADGSVELTSKELQTCKGFITQAHKVHDNMQEWTSSGSTGSGWQSYTAGMPAWLQSLQLDLKSASTPEFVDALQQVADGGASALEAVSSGKAPTEADYDPQAILDGLEDAAGLCESAGVNIVWHA